MPGTPDRRKSLSRGAKELRASFLLRDGRISLASCFDTHLGLRLRAEEAHRCVRRVFAGSFFGWSPETMELRCAPETSVDLINGKLSDLAVALARIAWRPLTPQLVAAALGISGQERARWTKDGRLPHSDQVHDRRGGGRLPIPTYTVALIEDLAVHPETLAAWRAQDAARGGQT